MQMCSTRSFRNGGFTLIELSIVLVVIGLLVGGILVGRDLIRAAELRAQISQIEAYQRAVNTFRGKYDFLPGDIPLVVATTFGFSSAGRVSYAGWSGDVRGNGTIEGWPDTSGTILQGQCETEMFWSDLGTTNLIGGTYPNGGEARICDSASPVLPTATGHMIPEAKLPGDFVYVYTDGASNWFGLSAVTGFAAYGGGFSIPSNPGITVSQAYNIDAKIDDGKPTTGTVITNYLNGGISFATSDASDSALTCYNTGGAAPVYSISYNNGNNANCALSFKFQ